MDVSTLHALTEELAALLSEVTQGDLPQEMPGTAGDIGDLYLRLIDRNVRAAAAITGATIPPDKWPDPRSRTDLDLSADVSGACGLEAGYRRSSRLVEEAFGASESGQRCATDGGLGEADLAALHETLISDTVIHTWDLAHALGFSYRPAPDIAQRVLRVILASRSGVSGERTDSPFSRRQLTH